MSDDFRDVIGGMICGVIMTLVIGGIVWSLSSSQSIKTVPEVPFSIEVMEKYLPPSATIMETSRADKPTNTMWVTFRHPHVLGKLPDKANPKHHLYFKDRLFFCRMRYVEGRYEMDMLTELQPK
jgi:hypothetical protein